MMEKNNSSKCDIEHLKIIEDVIARLANNAFVLQSWFITVFSGLLLVYLQKDNSLTSGCMFFLGIIIIVSFYLMNVNYLWLERCYRQKYQEVCSGECKDFDMDIDHLTKSNFCNKYRSFTFTIYLLAFVCLLISMFFKEPDVLCKLLYL